MRRTEHSTRQRQLVAEEQVKLDLVVPLAVEQELVVGRAVRADKLRVL